MIEVKTNEDLVLIRDRDDGSQILLTATAVPALIGQLAEAMKKRILELEEDLSRAEGWGELLEEGLTAGLTLEEIRAGLARQLAAEES